MTSSAEGAATFLSQPGQRAADQGNDGVMCMIFLSCILDVDNVNRSSELSLGHDELKSKTCAIIIVQSRNAYHIIEGHSIVGR